MGTIEGTISEQMKRDGISLQSFKPKPKLSLGLYIYIEAFFELDTERYIGQTIGRIPWSRIKEYAEYYGMNVEETLYFVRRMDDAYMDRVAHRSRTNDQNPTRPSQALRDASDED